jgi:predicted ArsR family transcriptional regulator
MTQQERILCAVADGGDVTVREVEAVVDLTPKHCAAHLDQLKKRGDVVAVGARRFPDASVPCVVWRATPAGLARRRTLGALYEGAAR